MEYENDYQQYSNSKYECLLFDVDDTLYPYSSGLSLQCTKNITEYMIEKLKIEESKVPEMCVQLYKDYGTTMSGLRAIGYDFDYDDYHSYVHGRLPYEEKLRPDPVLRNLLHSLPIRKVIFSNANDAHVATVLRILGIEDCFERIVTFESLNPTHESNVSDGRENQESNVGSGMDSDAGADPPLPKSPVICKPFENAFEQAFKIADINPKKTLFFDDSLRNLQTAKCMNLHTVLIGSSHRTTGVDYALESIHNIREALPELWEELAKAESPYSGQAAIETTVRA
ncbi:suppressor of disruption of TFIIS [Heracleum sosnowskyi]|uniref:Suppressor of disruption of TFIIS n=1 Tax=Heracleum sosnowskyi TaxID=360622 RepID=A0AAD8H0F3_9APIA|nr:suppressor of disruption of TFIIS [Heracleum sosnowskyi]